MHSQKIPHNLDLLANNRSPRMWYTLPVFSGWVYNPFSLLIVLLLFISMLSSCGNDDFDIAMALKQQQSDHQAMSVLAGNLLFHAKQTAFGDVSNIAGFNEQTKKYKQVSGRLFSNLSKCQINKSIGDYYGLLAQINKPSLVMLEILDKYLVKSDEITTLRVSLTQAETQLVGLISTIRKNVGQLAGSAKKKEVARTLNALSEYMFLSGEVRLNVQHLLNVNLFHQPSIDALLRNSYSIGRKLDTILKGNKRFNVPPIKGTSVRVILELLRVQYKQLAKNIKNVDDQFAAQNELVEEKQNYDVVFKSLDDSLSKSNKALTDILEQIRKNGVENTQCTERYFVSNWMKKVAAWFSS